MPVRVFDSPHTAAKFRNAGAMALSALGAAILVVGVAVVVEFVNGSDAPRTVPAAQAGAAPSPTGTPAVTPAVPAPSSLPSQVPAAMPKVIATPAVVTAAIAPPLAPVATAAPLPTAAPTPSPAGRTSLPTPTLPPTPRPSPTPSPGPSTPEPVLNGSLNYTCIWPISGPDKVVLAVNMPAQSLVNGVYPKTPVTVTVQLSVDTTDGFNTVGIASFEGKMFLNMVLTSPDGNPVLHIPLEIPNTSIPMSGNTTFTASGTIRALSFLHPGPVTLAADSVMFQLSAFDQVHNPIIRPGYSQISCTQNLGQNPLLVSFDVP